MQNIVDIIKINNKPLGFLSEDVNTIVTEVLESYMPLRPAESQLTEKAMLNPSIGLLDGSPDNVLSSNIIVANADEINELNRSLRFETVFTEGQLSVRAWDYPSFPSFKLRLRGAMEALKCSENPYSVTSPEYTVYVFHTLIKHGAKGLISVTIDYGDLIGSRTLHYADLLRYRASLDTGNLIVPPVM